MGVVYLVRHAHAPWNGDDGGGLSPQGRRDAERVADLLASAPIAAVYSSPYPRARETAEPLAARHGLSVSLEPDLRERALGAVDADDFVTAVRATWDDFALAHAGGETNAAAQRRAVAAYRAIRDAHPGAAVAVVTHGNLLALLLRHFDPSVGFAFWRALPRPAVYRLTIAGGVHVRDCLW